MTGVLAIDRAGVEDTIGDFDNRKDGSEEASRPVGPGCMTAGVGDIGLSVGGAVDTTVVGDDEASVEGTDEPRDVIVGF